MNPNDPNIILLESVAAQLGSDLLDELVFVGGAIAGLLITDPAMPSIRATTDVDLVCSALVRKDYYQFEERLRAQGFSQDMRPGAPICRWRIGSVAVDVMPCAEEVLGFANRWYPLALTTAQRLKLTSAHEIRVIQAPVFLATKLEAFEGRGRGDYLASHDIEDLLAIVDGREALLDECIACVIDLRQYLAQKFTELLASRDFVQAIAGHLPSDSASQERLPDMLEKLRQLAQLR